MQARRFLFVHQNFPAQFLHAAGELVRRGHGVVALGVHGSELPGVRYIRYAPQMKGSPTGVTQLRDFETQTVRGLACAQAMQALKDEGFAPDVIVAHPGWGEALFCRDVWPGARLIVFAEFFYGADGADVGFDKEFSKDGGLAARARLRLKNSVHLHALAEADAIYSPTRWQGSHVPADFRPKLSVIFDGIDTGVVAPEDTAFVQLKREKLRLGAADEVITFVNRNLEPYRGFHVFMRALPRILAERPNAHVLIIGRDKVSYGSMPAGGGSWREVMLAEVGHRLPMDRIHFLGGVPYRDYLRVLQVSSCHVYLTYPFVLSWSCLEAMSAARVVVASRTPPVQEVIEHGVNGLLFDFFDGDALAESVCKVLADRPGHRHLGRRARQTVVERYDLRTVCLPQQLDLLLGPDVRNEPSSQEREHAYDHRN
ncbi:MAG: glycosyltransferase [Caldimonas sp.]